VRVRTHHDRAIMRRASLFTKEHSFHGLAEEPLTLFPDVVRCPLSTAFPPAAIGCFALLGCAGFRDERELVGGGQGRERGT